MTDEWDVHSVAIGADWPIVETGLGEYFPMEDPIRVTVIDESAKLVLDRFSVICPPSYETASDAVFRSCAIVIVFSLLAPIPLATLQINSVSATHTVFSHRVLPKDTRAVYR